MKARLLFAATLLGQGLFQNSRRAISVLLIGTLLLPATFSFTIRRANAETKANISAESQTHTAAPAPPPLPFITANPNASFSSYAKAQVSSAYNAVLNVVNEPEIPAGLGAARVPSFGERLVSAVSTTRIGAGAFSIFGFGKPNSAVKSKTTESVHKSNESDSSGKTEAQPAAPAMPPAGTTLFDFDGDNKADISRWQPSTGEWRVRQSSNGAVTNQVLGTNGQIIAPANYVGDAKTDFATFNPSNGSWNIAGTIHNYGLGQAGDKVVSADYDGDGFANPAVWRPSNGTWYVRGSNGTISTFQFGGSNDIPAVGNYDGDTKADYALFRPSDGTWYVWRSSTGSLQTLQWGLSTDTPVPADYDGDNKTDFAVFRPEVGAWYAWKSSTADGSFISQTWGNYGDQPVPANYDSDNKADFAVWRPTTGIWYVINSSDQTYTYRQLGTSGDKTAASAYLKQIGAPVESDVLVKARLALKNSKGGTNLYSRNFGWSTGLFSLPGRSGLDAGMGLSYNSLVWTKVTGSSGSAMVFDVDADNVSPGFRFGYPTIEPAYYDNLTQQFKFVMVTPSGTRTEFRQIAGASGFYETVDSTYAQLYVKGAVSPNVADGISLTVTATDGTQMRFEWVAGSYRCKQIKDRNGNYITIAYDAETGVLQTVTDTLGRVVTVFYDNDLYPISIKQNWQTNNGSGSAAPHTWATFTYGNIPINTNFGSTPVVGPANGTHLKVLTRVSFQVEGTAAKGGYYTFEYNRYGQVYRINRHAENNDKLNHVSVNLAVTLGAYPAPDTFDTSQQTDCPRFSQTRTWAQDFNHNAGGAAQEVISYNTYQENQTLQGGGVGTIITATAPNGVIEKTHMISTGWAEALPFYSETCTTSACANSDKKRWVWTGWTQDDTNLTYRLNPRATYTTVSDWVSSRKTEIDYLPQSAGSNVALYGLVKETRDYSVYQNNLLLKKTTVNYNLNSVYTSRRIIGLPSEQKLYDGNNALMSKVTYSYDEGNFDGQDPNFTPLQHDAVSYGTSFIAGRGNLTRTTRWDANAPNDAGQAVSSQIKYNVAGGVVAQLDPLNRETKISYADSFNDNNSRNTFAYPTKVTDPAGYFSTVKYRYDIGANVRAESPAPAGQTAGKTTVRNFDSIGRLERETLLNTGAYTRYVYYPDHISLETRSTVTDFNQNGAADAADEVATFTSTDGAGRMRGSITEHPGSTGEWAAQLTVYDVMGRVKQQWVPVEMTRNWVLAGDDAARGVLETSQEYDWKGRPTRIVNTDGTDKLISYEGCGCAGGEVVTVKGELIVQPAANGQPAQNLGRRTQKIYSDVLGREYKTQIMNWDEITPYSTVVNIFNGRDQVTNSKHYQGTDTSGAAFQETTFAYDGHGRMQAKHLPEQDAATNTVYDYYSDDRIRKITDARGAAVNYEYNSRGLTERVFYTAPTSSTIPVPGQTTFQYDAAGNRTLMTDQTGSTTYNYDALSQLLSETKQFNGQNQSPTNSYTLSYEYQLSGALKSITEPFGHRADYAYDKIGRLKEVLLTPNAPRFNSPALVNNIQYRAWGATKSANYPTGQNMTQTFDNRLRVTSHITGGEAWPGFTAYAAYQTYSYYADGRIQFSKNLPPDWGIDLHDRSFQYDHAGRLKAARTSWEAHGQTASETPYHQNYSYDVWGNATSRQNRNWNREINLTHVYNNNRESTWQYDADGRVTDSQERGFTSNARLRQVYDAAGRITNNIKDDTPDATHEPRISNNVWQWVDGDGNVVGKKVTISENGSQPRTEVETFFINSSVLGGKVITEVKPDGTNHLKRKFVYAFGKVLAIIQKSNNAPPNDPPDVWIEHRDPSNLIYAVSGRGEYGQPALESGFQLDPLGAQIVERETEGSNLLDGGDYTWNYPGLGSGGAFGCRIDGAQSSCGMALRFLASEMGMSAPLQAAERVNYNGQTVWAYFRVYADGYAGYVPNNARYIGSGVISPIIQGKPRLHRRGDKIPDTDLPKLNNATGEWVNREGIQVLRNVGVDSYWNQPWLKRAGERISDEMLDLWRPQIEAVLNKPSCLDFLRNAFNLTAEDLLKVFDLTRVQGGFNFKSSGGGGYAVGDVNSNSATRIAIQKLPFLMTAPNSANGRADSAYAIGIIIHELIHASNGDWNDSFVAQLLHDKDYKAPIEFKGKDKFPNTPEGRDELESYSSRWWDLILGKYCHSNAVR